MPSQFLLVPTLVCALALALVHVFAGRMRFLDVTPRSIWLSIGGGISVAYIFVHVLPELSRGQEAVARAVGERLGFVENHVYLVALLGLMVFYGVERAAKGSRRQRLETTGEDVPEPGVFWVHLASFAVYNALVGYLLVHREARGALSLSFFFIAFALHFMVTDYGLRQDYKHLYHLARWIIAGALLVGWGIGAVTRVSDAAIAVLFGFLAGGVVLNVLKEELPEERQSRFWAFALGAVVYAVLLLLV